MTPVEMTIVVALTFTMALMALGRRPLGLLGCAFLIFLAADSALAAILTVLAVLLFIAVGIDNAVEV